MGAPSKSTIVQVGTGPGRRLPHLSYAYELGKVLFSILSKYPGDKRTGVMLKIWAQLFKTNDVCSQLG